ncbi:unnamed protein product, partial [Discosporangium mesarthrocarpum]
MSFGLVGVLVLLQTRGVLLTLVTVSRSSLMRSLRLPAQMLSLVLSLLMGVYFTSSVILMLTNLPHEHRKAITVALGGGMRFSSYQRWFDLVFFFSGCVTAITHLVRHISNTKSDADHHE